MLKSESSWDHTVNMKFNILLNFNFNVFLTYIVLEVCCCCLLYRWGVRLPGRTRSHERERSTLQV